MMGETNVQSAQKQDTAHSATVTASVKAEPTGVGQGISLNPWHFRTIPGIIKLVQLLFGIICMACASPVLTSFTHFFMFVAATTFLFTLVLCLAYLINFKSLVPSVPWSTVELLYTAVATILYIVAFIVQLAMTTRRDYKISLKHYYYYDAYVTAGVFGLFNTVAYGCGAAILFLEWKKSRQQSN